MNQVWDSLSPEVQASVIKALEVAEVKESDTFGPVVQKSLVTGQAVSCTSRQTSRLGYSRAGIRLWGYFQKIDWCWNGTTITSKSPTKWGEVYTLFWEFKGHKDSSESGGVGSSSYRSWTQGEFALCAPYILCAQYSYPWIEMTVFSGGGSNSRQGG
jgi:hypothetical protein